MMDADLEKATSQLIENQTQYEFNEEDDIQLITDKNEDETDYPTLSTDDKDVESSNLSYHRPDGSQTVSTLWIYILSIANFGIGSSWALEFAIVTPYFEKGLMAGSVVSHAVWVVGPLSGLIVAPLVGALSDRCTSRYGRRRPFIVGGLIATVFGMLTFSNAIAITSIFFNPSSKYHHTVSIVIAIISFCILDLAINTTMWPIRAIQGDLVPESQQHMVQSATVVFQSLGDLAVNAFLNTFDEPIVKIRPIFLGAAMFYTLTISTILILGRESPLTEDDPAIKHTNRPSMNVLSYVRGLPSWMWRIGSVYALGFFSFFCVLPNASTWIGSEVLGGDPNAAPGSTEASLYEKGVSLFGQAGIMRGPLQIIFSAIYPKLLDWGMNPGPMLASSFLLFSTYIFIFAKTNTAWIAQLGVVLFALPQATLLTLPIGLTVALSDESNRGQILGALNLFAVIPQLIDTAYTGIISTKFGEHMVMYVGAAWGLLTAVAALFFLKAY